jgi:signal peptidase I
MVAYHSTDLDNRTPTIYCKRLIGLPNERLRFEGGNLYANNKAIEAPEVLRGRLHAAPGAEQTLAHYRDGEDIVLGADECFVIGDNVDKSTDSRMRGPSNASEIVGVVDWIYWPLGKFRIVR